MDPDVVALLMGCNANPKFNPDHMTLALFLS